ncbi:Ribose import ATP-binding protein RbsA [Pelotomaculum sp. FP]|uniref:ABC transporter ATP-binding protein n=1 Tax=Pelotomaculum sp. FP TaxID=261474 RepID=UPI001064C1DA|nr:ABC transporter ATP-binding protein [Pelotomaculum sp. FP]TEB14535.1 Ribose import ATP-binding protein RbsA [Pelotomaculum sp. FP]
MAKTLLVEMKGITKRFPGVTANRNVHLQLFKGEIHALLGENGSGKSTLMSVLSGLYRPDEGEIYIRGEKVNFLSPRDSINAGIGMVHQHFRLVEPFTVAENVALGSRETPFKLRMKGLEVQIRQLSADFGLSVDPAAPVWRLSLGELQRVEIIKMLYRQTDVLILDEPTAVLTPGEVKDLFTILKKIAASGKAVVVITHKLSEVMTVADRVTVLREGVVAGTALQEEISESNLAALMIGREMPQPAAKTAVAAGRTVLELKDMHVRGEGGSEALAGVNIAVREGEILGIAGVAGNGQKELAEAVTGLRRISGGSIFLGDEDVTGLPVRQRIDRGIGYVPEDRLGTGLVPGLSATDNMILKNYRKPGSNRGFFIRHSDVQKQTGDLIKKFSVRLADPALPVRFLSGGNLQRLLLAREISSQPRLLVAVYPVRGLDIAATEAIHSLLFDLRATGAAVLLISDDLEEIFKMSDRIAVLYRGRVQSVFPNTGDTDMEILGRLMTGAAQREEEVS